MKKEILSLGKALTKRQQQVVSGGSGGCHYPSYQACMIAGCVYPLTCESYHCHRQSAGYVCTDSGNYE